MPTPPSALSKACRFIADFLTVELRAVGIDAEVLIGNPADARPQGNDPSRINLFFYRVDPGGFESDHAPTDPWFVRLQCLVTAFGMKEQSVGAGEIDLRLLGEVVRVFHEHPVFAPLTVNHVTTTLQACFRPLELEDINHLWSTQGDVTYRPSAAFEFSLAPIVPRERVAEGPPVSSFGLEVHADPSGRTDPFAGDVRPFTLARYEIDTRVSSWAPRLAFVRDGNAFESVAFAVGSPELSAFVPRVWVAGASGDPVALVWEVWEDTRGWTRQPGTVATTASGPVLDPQEAASAPTTDMTLPFVDHIGQAIVFAEREFEPVGATATVKVLSNPLHVNLYEASA